MDFATVGSIVIKVEVYGDNIKVYINEVLKIDYTDCEPFESGGIHLLLFDDSNIYDVIVTTSK